MANLRCVWFGCCCVTVKDRFHGVSGSRDPISFKHVSPSTNTHPMTTRLKNAIVKPNPKYGLSFVVGIDIEPHTVS